MTKQNCPYCGAELVEIKLDSEFASEVGYGLCTACRLDAVNE